jgi:hypothetical protein
VKLENDLGLKKNDLLEVLKRLKKQGIRDVQMVAIMVTILLPQIHKLV